MPTFIVLLDLLQFSNIQFTRLSVSSPVILENLLNNIVVMINILIYLISYDNRLVASPLIMINFDSHQAPAKHSVINLIERI